MRTHLCRLLLAVAGLTLATPVVEALELLPGSLRVGLSGGYDSNLLDASDAEINAFETADPGSFFVVRRMDDRVADLQLEGRWELGRVAGLKSELRLGYERLEYLAESIRNENRYRLDWRSRLGADTRLQVRFDLTPQIYGRHRRDKDALPGEPMFRAETQQRADLALVLTRGGSAGWQGAAGIEGTLRDYAEAFDERDRKRVGAGGALSWTRDGGPRFELGGEYLRSWSRNEPDLGSDLSYREWSLKPAISDVRLPAKLRLRLATAIDWRSYTSTDPDDEDHFRRRDTEFGLEVELARPISASLDWQASFRSRTRRAVIAAPSSFADEGAYADRVVLTGIVWSWKRGAR